MLKNASPLNFWGHLYGKQAERKNQNITQLLCTPFGRRQCICFWTLKLPSQPPECPLPCYMWTFSFRHPSGAVLIRHIVERGTHLPSQGGESYFFLGPFLFGSPASSVAEQRQRRCKFLFLFHSAKKTLLMWLVFCYMPLQRSYGIFLPSNQRF